MELNKIYSGHVLEVLKTFPDKSIDMVMTSPPYWALRNYKTSAQIWDGDKDCEHDWLESNFCNLCAAWKGELGNEPTFELYIKHLCDIFDEIKRVLKDDGSIYVNIGDTYASSGGASRHLGYSDPKYPNGRCGNFEEPNTYKQNGVKPKSLCMIPSRFAIEMCNRGWILRNEIVWCLEENSKIFLKRDDEFKYISIKEVKSGDLLYSIDKSGNSIVVKCKNVFNTGVKRCKQLNTYTGREIITTDNHEFPFKSTITVNHSENYIKLKTQKTQNLIENKDCLYVNEYLETDMDNNPDIEKYNDGFIVGFYLAEGSYIKNKVGCYKNSKYSLYAQKRWGKTHPHTKNVGVQFSCGKTDIDRGYIKYLEKYNIKIHEYGNTVNIQSRDKKLLFFIEKYIEKDLCYYKHLKQEAYNNGKSFLNGILDGFLAGDGYHDIKNDRYVVGICKNEELTDDIQMICRLLGYSFRKHKSMVKYKNGFLNKITMWIRKNPKQKRIFNMITDKIKTIDDIGDRICYDIEVEPIYTTFCGNGITDKPSIEKNKNKWNNLYFLGNGVWTHNCKPNAMPQSASDRFTVDFEKLLFFTKNEKYYFKQQFEPYTSPIDRWGGEQVKEYEGKYTELNSMNAEDSGSPRARNIRIGYPERERSLRPNALGRNKRSVWSINTKPFKDAHFATFCTEICKTPIDASCPSEICTKCGKPKIMKYDKIESGDDRTNRPFGHSGNNDRNDIGNIYIQKDTIEIGTIPSCDCNESFEPGIVLDPFMGSGTTAIESITQFKNWIGIELNPLYIEIAEKRIAEEFPYYNNSSLLEL